MKTKRMGRMGLKVSEICLGTMTFGRQCDEAQSFAVMDTAFENGVDFFDTADVYPAGGGAQTAGRTEEIVGKWLKGRRDDIVLVTKSTLPTRVRRSQRRWTTWSVKARSDISVAPTFKPRDWLAVVGPRITVGVHNIS